MSADVMETAIDSFEVVKIESIAAPLEIVFETLLEQLGPYNEGMPGVAMPMVLEAWPGGRWFRDLGNQAGHFWGHVQVIKPPTLLEICGPMFMSYPAASHVQFRLSKADGGTRLEFKHRAIGLIQPDHKLHVSEGWGSQMTRIRQAAEARGSAS